MQLDASIFKAYDIRGVVPTTVNESVAEALGLAFGSTALAQGERTVAVGRDGRLSGPALSAALIRGLVASGVDVVDIGMATTPMLYFAASTLASSGIQITGSHNPKDYNGFKMVLAGRAIYGDDIQGLRKMMEAPTLVAPRTALPPEGANFPRGGPSENSSSPTPPPRSGTIRNVNVLGPYRDRIVSDIKLTRPMKIVIDSGNGIAGASAPDIFRALGCEVTELFSEVDGTFPNHHPDPSKPENLKDLITTLQAGDAELGLAFDGDGDRLGIVTRDGQNIYPDRQMMLFARDVLSRAPGGAIVFDVKCSQRLAPEIEAAGGVPMMYRTGHSLIKAKMKEVNSPLGGEMSGHIFFKERWFGFDDGTYAGARLLEIVSRSPDAGELLNSLPTSFSTPELNVACHEGEPHMVVARLVELAMEAMRGAGPAPASPDPSGNSALREAINAGAKISTIDGVRIDWADGFGLIRASNTTPVLVLRFEGRTTDALARIQADMLGLLRSVKPDASFGAAVH
jgi:phosphomannomutase